MSGLLTYKRLLDVGESQNLDVRGVLIVLREAQGALTVTAIQNQTSGKAGADYTVRMKRREKWRLLEEFDQIRIANDTTVNMSVEILVGFGDYVLPPPEQPIGDVFNGQAPLVIAPTGTRILAYNARRFRANIKPLRDNTSGITLAGNLADALGGRGFLLEANDNFDGFGSWRHITGNAAEFAMPLESRGELWGVSAGQKVYVQEFNYVYNPSNAAEYPPPIDPHPTPIPPAPVGGTFLQIANGINSTGPVDSTVETGAWGGDGTGYYRTTRTVGGTISDPPVITINTINGPLVAVLAVAWQGFDSGRFVFILAGVHDNTAFTNIHLTGSVVRTDYDMASATVEHDPLYGTVYWWANDEEFTAHPTRVTVT